MVESGHRASTGYWYIKAPGHPLANARGYVYEHRWVLYARHGEDCPPCHWCGQALSWANAVGDHLDDDPLNNSPRNLVVSCHECNRARAAAAALMARLTDERLAELLELWHRKRQEYQMVESSSAGSTCADSGAM